jgi:hypothetical protein
MIFFLADPLHEVPPGRGIPYAFLRAFDETIKFLFGVGRGSTWRIVFDPIWDVVFVEVVSHVDLLRHDWFFSHNVSHQPRRAPVQRAVGCMRS